MKGFWGGTLSLILWLPRQMNDFIRSLDNLPGGWSSRKVCVYVGLYVAVKITLVNTDKENLFDIAALWLTFIAVCLGLIQAVDIIKFKNGTKEPEPNAKSGESEPNI